LIPQTWHGCWLQLEDSLWVLGWDFVGTLFLFILTANLLAVVPGFIPPTGSLSTATALAICVFAAVPLFGIAFCSI